MMQRNIGALASKHYDVVVVGGGIFGICTAWDAILRGLSVALIERGDFAQATSANHLKMVHGGIRYLQHGDISRTRESSHERSAFLRTAPHLVRPLPIVIPTYGHSKQGKALLRSGVLLYDMVTFDRNWGIADPQRHIPQGHAISRAECLRMFPGLKAQGLTGAVIFYDGQIYNSPRHALAFLKSAVAAGADAANYLEATGLLRMGERVIGVTAHDRLTGADLEIRGRVVINAAGPWAAQLVRRWMGAGLQHEPTFSRDAAFIVGRRLLSDTYALAVQGQTSDPDAILSRGHRHLFVVPWRDQTLVGVWHVVHTGAPEAFTVTEAELQAFVDEINAAYPLDLTLDDVALWTAGLVLFGENHPGQTNLSYGKRSIIVDHAAEHHIDGLITVIGVRYTTGRRVAEHAVDLAFAKLGRRAPPCATATTPIYGGQIEQVEHFIGAAQRDHPAGISAETLRALIHNHGSAYRDVLKYADADAGLAERLGGSHVIKAEVAHAVREEMAQKLSDVVMRRTELGSAGYPGEAALRAGAALMSAELSWSQERTREELVAVRALFPRASAMVDAPALMERVVGIGQD